MVKRTTKKILEISVMRHEDGRMLVAFCRDLRGLLVWAHTEEELLERLPAAVTEVLTAQGRVVTTVEINEGDDSLPSFFPKTFVAAAALAHR